MLEVQVGSDSELQSQFIETSVHQKLAIRPKWVGCTLNDNGQDTCWVFIINSVLICNKTLVVTWLTSMLETKCVGDNIKMLVTVLAILVTNIHYLFILASGTDIQKMSPRSKFCHQHPKIVSNFNLSRTRGCMKCLWAEWYGNHATVSDVVWVVTHHATSSHWPCH